MDISQETLNKAMKEAVRIGIFPKFSDEDGYLKHWSQMEQFLVTMMADPESKAVKKVEEK